MHQRRGRFHNFSGDARPTIERGRRDVLVIGHPPTLEAGRPCQPRFDVGRTARPVRIRARLPASASGSRRLRGHQQAHAARVRVAQQGVRLPRWREAPDRAPLRSRPRPRVRDAALRPRLRRPARAAHRRLPRAGRASISTTRSRRPSRSRSRWDRAACTRRRPRWNAAGLQYTARRVEDHGGAVRKCVLTVPPAIPAAAQFRVDYQTGLIDVALSPTSTASTA